MYTLEELKKSTLIELRNIASTLKLDGYEKLKKEFQFPIELEINEINFGISDVGQVGTYSVYDKCSI